MVYLRRRTSAPVSQIHKPPQCSVTTNYQKKKIFAVGKKAKVRRIVAFIVMSGLSIVFARAVMKSVGMAHEGTIGSQFTMQKA